MDNYYSSSNRKFWDFIFGFFSAIVINTILVGIVVYLIFTIGNFDFQWFIVYPILYIIEVVASWRLIKSKRHYIFIGVLVVLALILVPLLLSGACFGIIAAS
jgi:hypothetical protein